jgi:branched-subunit amino acid transport protein
MDEVLLILGMVVVTFGVRYPVLAVLGRIKMPDPLFRALRFVPPAVLTAIIAPAVLMPEDNQLALTLNNAHLVAGIVAGVVAWRTRSLLATIIVGMAVFLGWREIIR